MRGVIACIDEYRHEESNHAEGGCALRRCAKLGHSDPQDKIDVNKVDVGKIGSGQISAAQIGPKKFASPKSAPAQAAGHSGWAVKRVPLIAMASTISEYQIFLFQAFK